MNPTPRLFKTKQASLVVIWDLCGWSWPASFQSGKGRAHSGEQQTVVELRWQYPPGVEVQTRSNKYSFGICVQLSLALKETEHAPTNNLKRIIHARQLWLFCK